MRIIQFLILSLFFFCHFASLPVLAQEEIPGGKEFREGVRLQEANQWHASIKQFRAAADAYSLIPDYALFRISQSALNLGEKDVAASSLEELLKKHPRSPIRRRAQIRLGTLYFETDQFSRTIPLITSALAGAQWQGETASLTLMLAKAHFAQNDRAQGDSICWQLIHNSPETTQALEAVQLLEDVDTPQKKLAVTKVYARNKKLKEVLALLDELQQQPEALDLQPEILYARAQALALNGEAQKAAQVYQSFVKEYPADSLTPTVLYNLGEYHRSKQAFEDALSAFSRVVEQFPSQALAPQARWQRAKIFEKSNDPREHAEYEKILREYPQSPAVFFTLMNWGTDLYRAGQYDSARTIFEKLLSLNRNDDANMDALFWTGKSWMATGNREAGRATLQALTQKYPDSYQAFRARAILRSLDAAATTYWQPVSADWQSLLAPGDKQFQPVTDIAKTIDALSRSIPDPDKKGMWRLRFLLAHHYPEAKQELEFISGTVKKNEDGYALAWMLFQAQAYNDSIRVASSLTAPLADTGKTGNIGYLLYPAAYPDLIKASAFKYEVDPLLALAVMREESHFHESLVSTSDACGLMQILPKTGKWLAEEKLKTPSFQRADLFQPQVNIELGNYYLRYLLSQFDNNLMLTVAAYNWGESNLRNWMPTAPTYDFDLFVESIPADQTRRYVKKVFRSYAMYRSLYPGDWFKINEK